jgi:hypothetical protein
MVELDVLVKNVEANRLSDEAKDETSVTFDVEASLSEIDHQPGQFTLKYTIVITSQPPIARMDVAGTARITGEETEIQDLLKTPEGNTPPPVFMGIYQKVYAILYLLSGSLKIPYPSPGLMKVVKMATPGEVAAAPGKEEKTPSISA